jgi:alpha-galactosidase
MPREAAYRQGLKRMREAMGSDAFFLTCGAPILPSLGLCDALRVGPDVSGKWEDPRDATLLYNPTTPGTRNAIRTTVNRLWLQPLVIPDPDVAYFAERENFLTVEQKQLLQDIAMICNFKATSDLPQWMTSAEREALRKFLAANPSVQRLSHAKFKLDERIVDFSSALALPDLPAGVTKIQAALIRWLGSQPLALKMLKRIDDLSLQRRKKNLG